MKTLIPALDRFLYFLDSKFTIKLLTTESHARKRKQSKNNTTKKQQQPKKKDQHPQKTMAIDQAFGERGGISPIRFISFPAALTFPFAHSNWQNKIPVWLSSLSSAPGNHSSAAPYIQPPPNPPLFCHLSSAASSWQHIKHKHNACPFFWLEFKEEACHWAIWGHLRKSPRGRAHFSFSFSSHHHLLFLAPSVRLPCSACIPKQLLRSAAFSWNHHQRLPARLSTGSAHRESLSHLFHLDATFWIHHMRGQTASFQNRLRTEVNYTNWVAGGKGAWLSLDSSVNPDDLGFS